MTIFLQRNIIHHATILVTLITLVISCSSTRLIYTFVDKFIEEEVAYFLNLDVEEEILLETASSGNGRVASYIYVT